MGLARYVQLRLE
jgi:hypothetical protein